MQAVHVLFSAAAGFAFSGLPTSAPHACRVPELIEQKRDEATVRRLEAAWQMSYVTGDVETKKCILDRGFLELLAGGKIKRFEDELSATKTISNVASSSDRGRAPSKILIHGNAAVAYGRINTHFPDAPPSDIPFADYFVWENDSWHAYFSQQTTQSPEANW